VVTDLIARMLQVDPYKRIRMHEIMNHPWLKVSVPLYVHMPHAIYLER
jgi:serine/threonine protein kinase